MYKRGQVTIFIILGIVIVAVLAFVFYIGGISFKEELSYEEAQTFVSARTEIVSTLVESCAQDSAWVVLESMGQYGGHVVPRFDANNPHFELLMPTGGHITINYAAYVDENGRDVNTFPSVNEMEEEFENYLENVALAPDNSEGFASCIDNFDVFRDSFDEIDAGDVSVDVDFAESIIIRMNYPVTIRRSGYETTIQEYIIELPVNMNEIRSVSSRMISDVMDNNDLLESRERFADKYTDEIEGGLREDKIGIDWIDTISIDTGYNNVHNYYFTLGYEHPELEEAYLFNLLVGAGE
jgi:hypothetical protein